MRLLDSKEAFMKRFGTAYSICISLVCIACVFSGCSEYKPGSHEILVTARWEPFIQECKKFDYARSSYDNGQMIFLMSPEATNAEEYFDLIEDGAVETGWLKTTLSEAQLDKRSPFIKKRAKWIHAKFKSKNTTQKYFSRKLNPGHPELESLEIVELTFFADNRAVLFVSHYLD